MGEIHQSRCILLVEDDHAQAALVEAVFADAQTPIYLFRVADVDQALRFLGCMAPYESVPEPDLILLDLNLALRSGYELLEAIRGNPLWQHLKVVIFSSANNPSDIKRSLSLGATAHFGKPRNLAGYQSVVRQMMDLLPESV